MSVAEGAWVGGELPCHWWALIRKQESHRNRPTESCQMPEDSAFACTAAGGPEDLVVILEGESLFNGKHVFCCLQRGKHDTSSDDLIAAWLAWLHKTSA